MAVAVNDFAYADLDVSHDLAVSVSQPGQTAWSGASSISKNEAGIIFIGIARENYGEFSIAELTLAHLTTSTVECRMLTRP